MKSIPLYRYPASYAHEHHELEQYRASRNANIACKEAIEAAIREHYKNNRLDDAAAREVLNEYGYDRVSYVLAVTVRQKDWDARIASNHKIWAHSIPVYPNPDSWGNDRNCDYVVNSHSGLIDLFLSQVRMQEKELHREKPSILAALQQTPRPTSPNISAKLSEPER